MKSKIIIAALLILYSTGSLFANTPSYLSEVNDSPAKVGFSIGGIFLILFALSIGYTLSRVFKMRRQYQEI